MSGPTLSPVRALYAVCEPSHSGNVLLSQHRQYTPFSPTKSSTSTTLADVPFCCFTFLCVGAVDLEHTAAQAQMRGVRAGERAGDERDERRLYKNYIADEPAKRLRSFCGGGLGVDLAECTRSPRTTSETQLRKTALRRQHTYPGT